MFIKRFFSSIKKFFYEYFEIKDSLQIKSTHYFNNSKIYYINNFDDQDITNKNNIEIIYGIQPRLGGKYVTVGFVWGDDTNKKRYNVNQNKDSKILDKSYQSWKNAVSMSAVVISDYIKNDDPQIILIFSNHQNKLKKFRKKSFFRLLEDYVGDRYEISTEFEDAIYLINKKGYEEQVMNSVKKFLSVYGFQNITQY